MAVVLALWFCVPGIKTASTAVSRNGGAVFKGELAGRGHREETVARKTKGSPPWGGLYRSRAAALQFT